MSGKMEFSPLEEMAISNNPLTNLNRIPRHPPLI